jgi:hypothetical protein
MNWANSASKPTPMRDYRFEKLERIRSELEHIPADLEKIARVLEQMPIDLERYLGHLDNLERARGQFRSWRARSRADLEKVALRCG